MAKKLGKGLAALLGDRDRQSVSALSEDPPSPENGVSGARDGELREIPVDLIHPSEYQPRRDMRAQPLEELARSIHNQGVMQPVVVRETAPGEFELIAGERRWRACQLSGVKTIPAIIRNASNRDAVSMALIENIQREDLNAMEQAAALQRLRQEFGLTQRELAEAVGKSRESVANSLRLLGLEPEVRGLLEKSELEMGHARALLATSGELQVKLAREVVAKGLSVRQTEELLRRRGQSGGSVEPERKKDPDLLRLEESLAEKLGSKVAIRHTAKGGGKLVISYHNIAELEGILAHIK